MSVPALDRLLLERAQAGDPAAFGDLIRPHLPSLRRFAYAFARHWEDADDLAQEALLKAFRSLASFEARASLSTWLYSVTRSVCHDFYRGRLAHARDREDPLEDGTEGAQQAHVSPLDGPEALLASKDEVEQLWVQLKTLAPEFRVPLVLYEIEGLGYEEIAKIEGVPIGTIRSRLSRGRQQLKAKLAERGSVPPSVVGTQAGVRSSNPGSARP